MIQHLSVFKQRSKGSVILPALVINMVSEAFAVSNFLLAC